MAGQLQLIGAQEEEEEIMSSRMISTLDSVSDSNLDPTATQMTRPHRDLSEMIDKVRLPTS